MEARCYRGGVNRTRMKELQVTYVGLYWCWRCYFGNYCTYRFVVVRSMRNIRIIVAYDGTDLAGYQKQPNDKG